jgi:hypothetical protein
MLTYSVNRMHAKQIPSLVLMRHQAIAAGATHSSFMTPSLLRLIERPNV